MITKEVLYYDSETGEILKDNKFTVEDLKVRFKVGSSGYGKSSRFSKIFQVEDPMFEVGSYYQYFFKCLLHLEMSTNRIVNISGDVAMPNTPLDIDDFVELFKTSKKTVNNFLKYAKDRNIIAKIDKNGELFGYMVNPIYALNGNKITSMLYLVFRDSQLDKHIPTQDLKKLQEYLQFQPTLEGKYFPSTI